MSRPPSPGMAYHLPGFMTSRYGPTSGVKLYFHRACSAPRFLLAEHAGQTNLKDPALTEHLIDVAARTRVDRLGWSGSGRLMKYSPFHNRSTIRWRPTSKISRVRPRRRRPPIRGPSVRRPAAPPDTIPTTRSPVRTSRHPACCAADPQNPVAVGVGRDQELDRFADRANSAAGSRRRPTSGVRDRPAEYSRPGHPRPRCGGLPPKANQTRLAVEGDAEVGHLAPIAPIAETAGPRRRA